MWSLFVRPLQRHIGLSLKACSPKSRLRLPEGPPLYSEPISKQGRGPHFRRPGAKSERDDLDASGIVKARALSTNKFSSAFVTHERWSEEWRGRKREAENISCWAAGGRTRWLKEWPSTSLVWNDLVLTVLAHQWAMMRWHEDELKRGRERKRVASRWAEGKCVVEIRLWKQCSFCRE